MYDTIYVNVSCVPIVICNQMIIISSYLFCYSHTFCCVMLHMSALFSVVLFAVLCAHALPLVPNPYRPAVTR
jgi:hypothetical protein